MRYRFRLLIMFFIISVLFSMDRNGLGDLNDDNQINILDVIVLVNIITGTIPDPDENQLWAGDVNFDQTLDILDIVILVNVILGLEELPGDPGRILFLGNSYTFYNGGLPMHVENLVESAHPQWDVYTEMIAPGGMTLQGHWDNQNTREAIQNGNWDFVVLQEQSTRPVDNPQLMYEYAVLLDSIITESGAETMFFMTWARENNPGMIEPLAEAYSFIGDQLDAVVSPVGLAFDLSLDTDPTVQLYAGDGSHPSQLGTYLAGCVFYAVLWDESPVGITDNSFPEMTTAEREYLQGIAWQTVLDYNEFRLLPTEKR